MLRGSDRLGSAPYAVSVRSGGNLQLGNTGFSLDEALQGIPGLQVSNRYNYTVGERISIRGFGARSQFGARGIKILVDGIPATMADGQSTLDHLDIGALGRAEVLRGPAAAMYGNAGGGVLSPSRPRRHPTFPCARRPKPYSEKTDSCDFRARRPVPKAGRRTS